MLRRLGGEIAELSAFAAKEEAEPGEPILLNGRFELRDFTGRRGAGEGRDGESAFFVLQGQNEKWFLSRRA